MKRVFALVVLLFSGCTEKFDPPILISTIEGCHVYKIPGSYMNIYTTTCEGSTNWDQSCGRNCTHHYTVSTKIRKNAK